MDKNSLLSSKHLSKNNVAMFFIAAMLTGFLCARAVASIAMFLFVVNALRDVPPKQWLRQRWWLLGLIWVLMFAVSWFWSDNKNGWTEHVQVKIPFLILPLGFGFLPYWGKREVRMFSVILLGIMAMGVCYSLSFLFKDFHALIDSYKYSKTLRVPVYNDHISFSAAVAICVAWCFYAQRVWDSKTARRVLTLTGIFFALYLHILAAKTGLVALYLFFAVWVVRLLLQRPVMGVLAALTGLASVVTIYFTVPTFRERINYTYLTYRHFFLEGQRDANYSDSGRLISYDLSCRVIAQHPVSGVGAGDMLDEMNRQYDRYHPDFPPQQRLIPHNQFLTIALATGIPSMLAFMAWILAPLKRVKRNREGFFFVGIWLMLQVQLFTDPSLEVQFGVFVYLFFLLVQRKLLIQQTDQKHDELYSHLPA